MTVRLPLPPDARVRYARGPEAGVEMAAGDRLFYVTAALAAEEGGDGDGPLRAFARRNSVAEDAGHADVSAEVRDTPRGPVWVQRYTDRTVRDSPARFGPGGVEVDRLRVVRCAEVWQGVVLELRFYLPPDRRSERESAVWDAVRGAEVRGRRE